MKNLLNWTPNKGNPFIISRANDPFDNDVTFDSTSITITFTESITLKPTDGVVAGDFNIKDDEEDQFNYNTNFLSTCHSIQILLSNNIKILTLIL